MSISERAKKLFHKSEFQDAIQKVRLNPYDKEKNSSGIINLGVAASILSHDLMTKKISEINKMKIDPTMYSYGDFTGSLALKTNICNMFKKHIFKLKNEEHNKSITPNDFAICNGGGTAIESFGRFLCDPNESLLISSPWYLAFNHDLSSRIGCKVFTVPKKKNDNEKDVLGYEFDFEAIENCVKNNRKIRGVLWCNPNNPTGNIYCENDIKKILNICLKYNIHFISDEIYCLSTLKKKQFISVVQVIYNNYHDKKIRKKLFNLSHIIYSLSKDFGLNGFRCGIIFSKSKKIIECFQKQSYFTACSFPTAVIIERLFQQEKFIDMYIKENQKRLQSRYEKVIKVLNNAIEKGVKIRYVKPKATMFIWIKFDFIKDFISEKKLFNDFINAGVYAAPGKFFESSECGFFRLSYTGQNWETVEIGLNRIISIAKNKK